jgi:Uma2 family endonuclease
MNPIVPDITRRHMSVDQYLAFELQSPVRHEYLAGEVFAMSGVSVQHNAIASRLLVAAATHLRGAPWHAYMSDVKVRVKTNMREYFYYPDLMVIADSDRLADAGEKMQFVRSPKLIAEVISASTENIDRREKAMMYREISTLEEYVLVSQEECEVAIYRRRQNWRPVVCNSLDELAELRSIGLSLPLAHIYHDAPRAVGMAGAGVAD